ncbi:flagellar biosynthesis anti-sigma factor FlgM [Acidovorax sp.]|uniref:flagellar biosynthesis anti-sigma factor FlgM n=1 Tax=Acidovorax sp. TaxID=1872122 RepID=UPI002ACE1917|nr:flagellar biosynthesis anti-sigma factor FlgM [Acidovorax sp.]MDZ7861814.1 flagellar biosynthesis anti-sigma factor FlgM [Acidovorax sp.]
MKIGQQPELPGALAQTGQAKQAKAPAAAPATPEGVAKGSTAAQAAGVPVTVSTAARALDPAGRAASDFDTKKVAAVRAAIEKGTFTVSAGAIADKLLANAQEIFSRSRG